MNNNIDILLAQIANNLNLMFPMFYPNKLQLKLTNFLSILWMDFFHKKQIIIKTIFMYTTLNIS